MIVNLLKLDYLRNPQLHWKSQRIYSSRNIGSTVVFTFR